VVEATVIKSVQNYLRKLKEQGFDISFGVVFGSYVSGKANDLSDIDLIVISPAFDERITRDNIDSLWEAAAFTDSRIEPIPCGRKQWDTDEQTPIISIARGEGQIINLN
jgi:predicted nucleotidyltransferase